MKTITLDIEMNFIDAVKYLLEGKCIGIKPKSSTNFLVEYMPEWMNKNSTNGLLCWNRSLEEDGKAAQSVRAEMYLEIRYPVVIDTKSLPENIRQIFILKDISGLLNSKI